jgi:predicted nucleotidyltransferase
MAAFKELTMTVTETIALCKETLTGHYGAQLRGLLLYGSTARGQATPESDIDLLVLLDRPFDYFAELRRIVDLLYPIQLESDRLISAKPAFVVDYERGSLGFYRQIRREGVAV